MTDKELMRQIWEAAWYEMREAFDMYDTEDEIFQHSMSTRFEHWYKAQAAEWLPCPKCDGEVRHRINCPDGIAFSNPQPA